MRKQPDIRIDARANGIRMAETDTVGEFPRDDLTEVGVRRELEFALSVFVAQRAVCGIDPGDRLHSEPRAHDDDEIELREIRNIAAVRQDFEPPPRFVGLRDETAVFDRRVL